MNRIFNFNSGPSMLPEDVLKKAQQELCNWNDYGVSVMEISHRSKEFIRIIEETEEDLRDLLNIPSNYKVLFCQGGARGQFSALPLNLLGNQKKADYISTGYWSVNAIKEAKKYCIPNIFDALITINDKYNVKKMNEWKLSHDAAYVHYCSNETIDGIAIHEIPNFSNEIIVTADFSSAILSEPINISRFGLIYACAQKNIGPSGLTLVIIRDNLLGKASKKCPSILDYSILSKNNSVFNTPPTFTWYLISKVLKWLKKKGGITVVKKINRRKANLLYDTIDNSDIYQNNVAKDNRSYMNIPFNLRDSILEKKFLQESFFEGLYALDGHRVVGGIRASIYNAMPFEGVKALTDFMLHFERRYG